ncbi:MAG: hypothetical protein VB140_09945 [Burkholderia sp.]
MRKHQWISLDLCNNTTIDDFTVALVINMQQRHSTLDRAQY